MMIIDDGRQCCRIGFVADVPLRSPDQAGVGHPMRTFCHPPQAQIGGIGQYGGHQGWPILGGPPLRTWVKRSPKPVHPATSASRSVMRMRGNRP